MSKAALILNLSQCPDMHALLLEAITTLRHAGFDDQAHELHQRGLNIPSWHRMAILVAEYMELDIIVRGNPSDNIL